MAFQLKTFPSIVAAMINHVRGATAKLTDFNIGAINRLMLEAVGIEIEEGYQQFFNGLREAIPVATYQSFNFDRLPAAPATGILHVVVAASAVDVTIPAGQVFSTPASSTTYVSQADVTIAASATSADISVVAADAGSIGNIAAGQSFSATPTIQNFVSATNVLLFNDGREIETDPQRKQRFQSFITTIQRGTDDALLYGATTAALFNAAGIEVERVRAVSLIEPWRDDNTQPISWVQVFVHNGVGSTSADLVARVDAVLRGYVDPDTGLKVPGWVAAGTKLDVAAATEVQVNLVGAITASPGFVAADLATAAEDAVEKLLLGLNNGATLQLRDVVLAVSAIDGVANFVIQACDATPLWATSATSLVVGTGGRTFTTQSGKGFNATLFLQAFSAANPANRMLLTVTSYSGTSLVTTCVDFEGTGTHTDWIIAPLDPDDVTCLRSQKLMPGGTLSITGA